MALPAMYSRQQLRAILNTWHSGPSSGHPPPFPGPLAAGDALAVWLEDVRRRCVNDLNLHQWHWPNAVLSWIPEGPKGFRQPLLVEMREKRKKRELRNDRFWEWDDFKKTFEELCGMLYHRSFLLHAEPRVSLGESEAIRQVP